MVVECENEFRHSFDVEANPSKAFRVLQSQTARIAALEAQLAERVKVKPLLIDFEDFINEPPQYEELRTVRDYRHELYRRWDPLCRAILSALEATLTAAQESDQ